MDSYSNKIEELYSSLSTNHEGLSQKEADSRLEQHGKNALDEGKKRSMISKFFAQFKDMMIIVLIVASIVSATIAIAQGEYHELIDSGIIMLIVIVNAVIGLVQESKAESALDALKNMNKPFSKVLRNGDLIQIKSEDLVVGDVVQLDAGDIVPADLRLISSASLKIEEAALTGESVPAEKEYSATVAEKAPLGDRLNMAYSGGVVTYGRGRGLVVAKGMDTEVGKIAKLLSQTSAQVTPLQNQLNQTAKILSVGVLAIAAVIFVAALIRGTEIVDAFMTSVAIAVAAIPEGLPAVVTIVLAMGVQRMSKRNAIIRNLPAVETLGCCEIICSDKTGTLTLNQMTVQKVFTIGDGLVNADDYSDTNAQHVLARAITLCNDSELGDGKFIGDPTETALTYYSQKHGFDYNAVKSEWERIDEIPFDSTRKLMTTVNKFGNETIAHIKGATDIMLNLCKDILDGDTIRPITSADIASIKTSNDNLGNDALRVLGVAIKKDDLTNKKTLETDMVFVGLVGMIDPPRKEAKDAVAVCKKAGMKAIMITGDHLITASAIARELGILNDGDKVMLGTEIDKLSDKEFKAIIKEYSVFARVSPENKVRIVKAYRSFGKVVAMTGDGVNDAPSIKEADIGIGMGITGTDVSKGAADMILTDDNFATIIGAVEEGRKIFSNIKKAIQFLLSANIAEVLCLFIATIFLGVPFLTPVMILWINLVTDSLPALSLGMEDAETDLMNYPPRNAESSLFAGTLGKNIIIQGIMQTALVMFTFCMGHYVLPDGVANDSVGMTMAFVTLCMIQLFHSFNLRSEHGSVFGKKMFANEWLNLSFLAGVILTLVVVLFPPLRSIFDTVALNGTEWIISLGTAFMIIPFVEIQKLIQNAIAKKSK